MAQVSFTRKPRAISWMLLSFALVLVWALIVPAQARQKDDPGAASKSPGKGDTSQAESDAAKAAEEKQDAEGVVDTAKAAKATLEERYVDPRLTDQLLELKHPLFTTTRPLPPRYERTLLDMAAGVEQFNQALLAQYVHLQAAEWTNHRNIQAMLDLNGRPEDVSKIDEAARKLVRLYDVANEKGNKTFRDALTTELTSKSVGGELLKNNIFARNEYMVVLSRSQDPKAIPVFVSELNDHDQLLSVKLLAAVGLTNLVQEGRDTAQQNPNDLIRAARALSDFLTREKDTFWPVQFRALQALGSLRVSTERPNTQKAEFAETALTFLADPDTKPVVRAWAAWALGMLTPVTSSYNYALVASHAGYAAAGIGDQIVDVQPKNPDEARKLTEALLEILECFRVDPQRVRNAGLLNMGSSMPAAQQSSVLEIEKRVRAVAATAVALEQAITRQQPAVRVALAAKVKELQDYLDAHRPTNVALVPDGAVFPLPEPKPKPLHAADTPKSKSKSDRGPQATGKSKSERPR